MKIGIKYIIFGKIELKELKGKLKGIIKLLLSGKFKFRPTGEKDPEEP